MERLLKSRYRIGDKIGESPFCVTYRGSYLDRNDPLIIKIYKRSVLSSSIIKSVKKKVRALCSLSHQNIAKVIDGDYGWQGFYFVRSFVSGRTLSDMVASEGKLSVETAERIITGVCEALSAAHSKGILHGALNPDNVFIDDSNAPVLTDFIIVGEMRAAVKERSEMMFSASSFLSPEEIGGRVAGFSSDIYAAGLLLYYMLAGQNPLNGPTGLETSLKILKETPVELRRTRGDVPDYLESIAFKAMEKDPLMRFRSVSDMLSSIKSRALKADRLLGDEPCAINLEGIIDTAGTGESEAKIEQEEQRPNFLLAAVVIFIAAAVGIGYAVFTALAGR